MGYINEQNDFLFDVSQLVRFAIMEGFEVTGSQFERPEELILLYYYGYKIVEENNDIKLIKYKQRSKTKKSIHAKRRAFDLNFFKDGVYLNALPKEESKPILQPLADYFKSLHPKNKWGGEFRTFYDPDHFERT